MKENAVSELIGLVTFVALTIVGAAAVHRVRHTSPPPINHCPGSDPANRRSIC